MKHQAIKIEKGKYNYRDFVIENQGYCPYFACDAWGADVSSIVNDKSKDYLLEKSLGDVKIQIDNLLSEQQMILAEVKVKCMMGETATKKIVQGK